MCEKEEYLGRKWVKDELVYSYFREELCELERGIVEVEKKVLDKDVVDF